MAARSQVEQAKGALAYAEGLTLHHAYDSIVSMAAEHDETITDIARRVVAEQLD